MEQEKKLKIKDKITIHIKKTKQMKCSVNIAIIVVLLILVFVLKWVHTFPVTDAPEYLTSDEAELRVSFTGDIRMSGTIQRLAEHIGYSELFQGVSSFWKDSDYVVANVSAPVLREDVSAYESTRKKDENSDYLQPEALNKMQEAGINLMSFANDDVFNYGRAGIQSTIDTLNEYGINYTGIASDSEDVVCRKLEYTVVNQQGVSETRSIAVIGVNDTVRKYSTVGSGNTGVINSSLTRVYEAVLNASMENDYVVAYVHFKNTGNNMASEENKKLARALIDAGASLVVGNENELQGVERYGTGIISYGLGNVVTEESNTYERDSAMLDLVVTQDGKAKVYLTPIRVDGGRPVITSGKMYSKRMQAVLTKGLEKEAYEITADGAVMLELGNLPLK